MTTGAARSVSLGLEHRDVLQQCNDTDDDDDDLSDLLGASVKRQAPDQVENQHDNQEGDQDADENRCSQSPTPEADAELRRMGVPIARSAKRKVRSAQCSCFLTYLRCPTNLKEDPSDDHGTMGNDES